MDFKIEPATINDAAAINALVNSGYRGDLSKQGWTTEADLLDGTRSDLTLIEEILRKPDSKIIKYVESNEILGCMELRNERPKLYLGMLTVRPNLQGKGIGKKLLEYAEAEAKKLGLDTIRMTVIERRIELVNWYARHGYIKKEVKPFDINDPRFGIPKVKLEFVVMEKSLG